MLAGGYREFARSCLGARGGGFYFLLGNRKRGDARVDRLQQKKFWLVVSGPGFGSVPLSYLALFSIFRSLTYTQFNFSIVIVIVIIIAISFVAVYYMNFENPTGHMSTHGTLRQDAPKTTQESPNKYVSYQPSGRQEA